MYALHSHDDAENRLLVWDALSPLGPGRVFGGFAIFFWAKLPDSCKDKDDKKVVEWLVQVILINAPSSLSYASNLHVSSL